MEQSENSGTFDSSSMTLLVLTEFLPRSDGECVPILVPGTAGQFTRHVGPVGVHVQAGRCLAAAASIAALKSVVRATPSQ